MKLGADEIAAEAFGEHERKDGLPVLSKLVVRYRLRIPAAARAIVDQALARHVEKCPTAAWMKFVLPIEWSAAIEEV